MSRNAAIFWDAFFDGISGAGLFGKLRRPGAPTCLVDMRSVDELKASGEFEEMLLLFKRSKKTNVNCFNEAWFIDK